MCKNIINYYSADYVLPVSSKPLPNGVVALNPLGEIYDLYEKDDPLLVDKSIKRFQGIIVPGFINSHCHLELSYLHGEFPKHTGLINFLQQVINARRQPAEGVEEAMQRADHAMYENGIVAVGDISNQIVSKEVKAKSLIYYHTYVELIGLDSERVEQVFESCQEIQQAFASSSIVPHAPYSVCKELFLHISKYAVNHHGLLSMHNQETDAENAFYQFKTGPFLSFYQSLNLDINFLKVKGRSSLQTVLPWLPVDQPLMLVHNLCTSAEDIAFLHKQGHQISWCLCPNANQYISNRLPSINLFLNDNHPITLGTDSLASNERLCILSELKTLHQSFPRLELAQTIAWATLHGAQFLRIDQKYGSIEKGKQPGLNLITHVDGLKLTDQSAVIKLA